ncbi:MAG TPA: hypothetical protein PLY88_04935 [Candidatus Omnitrophota bacterium]|nr:hypothetical protein [Candidatus Omnitrophota bacterium]
MNKKPLNTNAIDWERSIQIGVILTLVSTFFILSRLDAFEAMSFETAMQQQPTTSVPDTAEAVQKSTPADSESEQLTQDFLNETSPLSKPSESLKPQDISFTEISGPGKQCSSTGDAGQGSQGCLQRNADGSFSEIEAQWENFGDEIKKQIIVKNYDAKGDQISEETIRIKASGKILNDGTRVLEKESIDIVKQPAQGKVTRDLIVKNYEKGQSTKVTWAHYVENPNIGALKAGLAHHAVLYYENGKVKAGFANQYKNGRVVDTLLNYNPAKNPNLRLELTGITKWANWIDQLVQAPIAAMQS